MVLQPNLETYHALLDQFNSQTNTRGGVQALLNVYFSSWLTNNLSCRLPYIYNCICPLKHTETFGLDFYTSAPAWARFGENIRIVHFSGQCKPWHLTETARSFSEAAFIDLFHSSNRFSSNERASGMLRYWWALFVVMVKHVLHPDMFMGNFECSPVNNSFGQSISDGGGGSNQPGSQQEHASNQNSNEQHWNRSYPYMHPNTAYVNYDAQPPLPPNAATFHPEFHEQRWDCLHYFQRRSNVVRNNNNNDSNQISATLPSHNQHRREDESSVIDHFSSHQSADHHSYHQHHHSSSSQPPCSNSSPIGSTSNQNRSIPNEYSFNVRSTIKDALVPVEHPPPPPEPSQNPRSLQCRECCCEVAQQSSISKQITCSCVGGGAGSRPAIASSSFSRPVVNSTTIRSRLGVRLAKFNRSVVDQSKPFKANNRLLAVVEKNLNSTQQTNIEKRTLSSTKDDLHLFNRSVESICVERRKRRSSISCTSELIIKNNMPSPITNSARKLITSADNNKRRPYNGCGISVKRLDRSKRTTAHDNLSYLLCRDDQRRVGFRQTRRFAPINKDDLVIEGRQHERATPSSSISIKSSSSTSSSSSVKKSLPPPLTTSSRHRLIPSLRRSQELIKQRAMDRQVARSHWEDKLEVDRLLAEMAKYGPRSQQQSTRKQQAATISNNQLGSLQSSWRHHHKQPSSDNHANNGTEVESPNLPGTLARQSSPRPELCEHHQRIDCDRRAAWERGQADYMGRDRFANVLARMAYSMQRNGNVVGRDHNGGLVICKDTKRGVKF